MVMRIFFIEKVENQFVFSTAAYQRLARFSGRACSFIRKL